jgi:2,3,4,5-tetrahydropyridine-2,6-dicarboxylate N-succinyltransferase
MSDWTGARALVEAAFADRRQLEGAAAREAVLKTMAGLDRGELRVAEKVDGEWKVNAWLMQAVNLYFGISGMVVHE